MTSTRTTTSGPATRRTVLALAAALGVFAALLTLVQTRWGPLHNLDRVVAHGLNTRTAPHPDLAAFWRGVSTVLQPLTFQTAAVVGALVLWWRAARLRLAVFVAVTVLSAGVLSTVVKTLVDRHRPSVPVVLATARGASFPSGHALASAVSMIVLSVVAAVLTGPARARLIAAVALFVAVLVGVSRLALGVHYLSDVVGAWVLAAAWVLGLWLLVRPAAGES